MMIWSLKRGMGALAAMLLLICSGCKSSGPKEDPILRLSSTEALEEGKALMEAGKYQRAQEYFTHAFEVDPNSAGGREGLLLAADSLFRSNSVDGFVRGEAKYRDFQNRFPTSDNAAYVQFQIANCLSERMRKPDRDQSPSEKALAAYDELIRLFPDSEYVDEAREKSNRVRSNLAEHEFLVGHYNYRRRLMTAAINRFESLLETYPDYDARDKAIYFLAKAYAASKDTEIAAKADEAIEQLREGYPESEYLKKISSKESLK
jgi:outer membrane protein assembly factor BamD